MQYLQTSNRFSSLYLAVVAVLAVSVSACSPPSNEQSNLQPLEQQTGTPSSILENAEQTESQKLADFFAKSFEDDLKRSPMQQSRLGYKWDYDKWNDVSDVFLKASQQRRKDLLNQASTFDMNKLDASEQLSLRLYITDLNRRIANDEFEYHTYIMHQFSAWHTTVPSFLINIHKVASKDDAQAYIGRLENVAPLFSQVIEQLRIREEQGIFPPRWSYEQMIVASQNVITGRPFDNQGLPSTIWGDFTKKVEALKLDNATKEDLLASGKAALVNTLEPAYQKLIAELQKHKELSPEGDGVWRLPQGSEWYQNRLNWFTTTDLNAQEVHDLGLKEVGRIHEQMKAIMEKVAFTGTLVEFFEFMRSDPQFYYPDTDEGRERYMKEAAEYIDVMEAKIPEYFGLRPKARMIVKRVEAFREKSAGKAFYQSPSKDGTRPGIYYANLYNMENMPTYQMEALAYHEGIPGHHMQRAIAQELEGIPEFQKYISFTAYTEGWGLYTEELGKDMGFYQDPYSDFGRLAMELWRACRLVVDTGLHEMKWSREKAIDYLVENTPNSVDDSTRAIERYIAMPGQATAYLVGKIKIMELREKAKQSLGDKFDYRGFHDEILKDGPVPMSILEEKIDNWIARTKA
jgi:uncharacterized protein (DUF885 family)